jgi:hypothetical protein
MFSAGSGAVAPARRSPEQIRAAAFGGDIVGRTGAMGQIGAFGRRDLDRLHRRRSHGR